MNRIIFICISYLFCIGFLNAQNNSTRTTLRGFVFEKNTSEPIMFANVILQGIDNKNILKGAATDVNGLYNITSLESGNYKLIVTYIGYDTTELNIFIKAGEVKTKNIEITESSVKLNEVKISGERIEMKTEVKAASIKITSQDLKIIPSIGGEPDLAQYMQIIPGVVFTGDQGGQLYIRGGSPIQNKVLLDGMTIYSPFHSIGLFSVFDSDIIRTTDVYTGGFGAEYGGRVSSIMDIKTIDGGKKLTGKLSSNTFGSKVLVKGPISKNKKSSFILSAKTSYLDKTSEIFYKEPILFFDDKGLPYSFTDIYSKISFQGNNGSKLSVFGFNFTDKVNYENVSKLNWKSNGVGSQFTLLPNGSPILIEGNIAYSNYLIELNEIAYPIRSSSISGFDMGLDFTSFPNQGKLKYGFDIHGFSTDFTTYNSINQRVDQDENTTEFSSYFNYQFKSIRWIVEPGLRLQYYGKLGTSLEPRIGIKYITSENLRLKLAAGNYSQNILSTSSDRDIVSLFNGTISSPEDIKDNDGSDLKQKFQKSQHLILGIEFDLNENIDLQIEGYIKDFSQLTNINRNRIDESDPEFIIESGIAKGIDLLFKYKKDNIYLWTVYSYGSITRKFNELIYNPNFDRRHNINFVASYNYGKNKTWKTDLRWNLGSGFPFTQTQGFYEQISFSDGINTNYNSENGNLGIIYSDLNEGRLPYYHRLDLSTSKKIKFNEKSSLEISGSITNIYNRENIFYFNRIKNERINQLPFMPSVGVNFLF
ncbi:MAG: TonB-dependent receptor [Flavobacteriales bacterium]|nr:TonB-dependent receptor [Flavobacteriales bacterium]